MRVVNPSTYLDLVKLPILVELIDKFCKQDLSKFFVDVGEHNVSESINWKSVIVYDADNVWNVSDDLKEKARSIIDYTKTVPGIIRIQINFLHKYSFMPIHIDDETSPEYDTSDPHYNIILPITDHGWSIVDYTVVKNKKGVPIIFNGQVPHGAMNDTLFTRITVYLIVDKDRFYDCTK